MTILVVISHFFAELPGGLNVFAFGWIAVDMFFVLSGFLVGRLILEKGDRANFFTVFYVRRVCRTFPIYFFCVLVLVALFSSMPPTISEADVAFPTWSYLTFTQNFFMIANDSIGAHWLAPTWTLAVEEQFYLFAPAVLLFTPRRFLLPVLVAVAAAAVVFRGSIFWFGYAPMAAYVLFPAKADILVCGLIAAVVLLQSRLDWKRYDDALRVAPIVLLVLVFAIRAIEGKGGIVFETTGHLLVSLASAAFLLAVVRGAPEGKRLTSNVLCFFGNTSYAVYLTHLPILWLAHGLVFGAKPALASPLHWLVTLGAMLVVVPVGWALTRLVEEPITAYGRRWKWSDEKRQTEHASPVGLKQGLSSSVS